MKIFSIPVFVLKLVLIASVLLTICLSQILLFLVYWLTRFTLILNKDSGMDSYPSLREFLATPLELLGRREWYYKRS